MATLGAVTRQGAQELVRWDTKSEAAGLDRAEMVRLPHEGRKRAREFAIARQLEVRRAAGRWRRGRQGANPVRSPRLVDLAVESRPAPIAGKRCNWKLLQGRRGRREAWRPLDAGAVRTSSPGCD
jgi:hypothetical protein